MAEMLKVSQLEIVDESIRTVHHANIRFVCPGPGCDYEFIWTIEGSEHITEGGCCDTYTEGWLEGNTVHILNWRKGSNKNSGRHFVVTPPQVTMVMKSSEQESNEQTEEYW